MSKDTYYFSHDANARNDEKVLMLRAEHGMEGYGIYWALVEMMFENSDTKLNHDKIRGMAVGFNVSITVLQDVINTCIAEGLFISDNEKFWSESLVRRKSVYQEARAKKSAAGKKGMEKRWGNKRKDNTVMDSDNTVITKDNKGKDSKGDNSKVDKDIPSKLDAYALEIFEYYNSKDLIKHKAFTTSMKGKVITALKAKGFDGLKKIIDNYHTVFKGDEFFFDTEYTLEKLMRKKDLDQFDDEAKPLQNFLIDKRGNAATTKNVEWDNI